MAITKKMFPSMIQAASDESSSAYALGAKAAEEEKQRKHDEAIMNLKSMLAPREAGEVERAKLAEQLKVYLDPRLQKATGGEGGVTGVGAIHGSRGASPEGTARQSEINKRYDMSQVADIAAKESQARIPEWEGIMKTAEKDISPDRIEKAYGGLRGLAMKLPGASSLAQAHIQKSDPEAWKTIQALEGLKSFVRNQLYAGNLTQHEAEYFERAFGSGTAGDPKAAMTGLSELKNMVARKKSVIRAGKSPQNVETYEAQKRAQIEKEDAPIMQPQSSQPPQAQSPQEQDPRARLEELRRKARGGV